MPGSTKCTACVLVIVVAIVILVVVLLLGLSPSSPTYTIVGFSIPVSSNDRNATFTFFLNVKNRNKFSNVNHDEIKLAFDYNEDILANITLPSFREKFSGTHHFAEEVEANARVWKALVNAIATNKTAEVKVDLVTRGSWAVHHAHMSKSWKHLQGRVPIGSDGKIPRKKKIKLKRVPKKQISSKK
ncbi:uncharacterized protein LOC132281005 [Cornus florida]|uniref:uncharacterized protein LOC132281005 n=1 Tax=Cornus florida TaxID=4283 RepID=UPI00289D1BAF|nr:uncharacterized protein LOC132281005 [Cornus florida]